MRELTYNELDAVSGGGGGPMVTLPSISVGNVNLTDVGNVNPQINTQVQVALALAVSPLGNASTGKVNQNMGSKIVSLV